MSGSTVKVVGEYALSIISLNGSINIQTDINMTCGETVLNKTCLGGYTQSAAGVLVLIDSSSSRKENLYKGKGNILISFSVVSLFHSRHYSDMLYGRSFNTTGPSLLFDMFDQIEAMITDYCIDI